MEPLDFQWVSMETMNINGPSRKPAVGKKRDIRCIQQGLPPPPEDESVPEIPRFSSEFSELLSILKNEAFSLSQARNLSQKRDTREGIHTPPYPFVKSSGYIAFSHYYKHEFYDLPRNTAMKFFGPAWAAYPDKPVWQFYAHQYGSYARETDFVTWLNNVPKHPRDGPVFLLSPESRDPMLSEIHNIPRPRDLKFLPNYDGNM